MSWLSNLFTAPESDFAVRKEVFEGVPLVILESANFYQCVMNQENLDWIQEHKSGYFQDRQGITWKFSRGSKTIYLQGLDDKRLMFKVQLNEIINTA